MDAEPAHWLALNRLPALGGPELRALAEGLVSPRDLLGSRARPATDWRAVEADLAWLAAPGRNLITLAMAAYPAGLRHIPDPPPVLFVEGDAPALCLPQIAVVGSRRATPWGVETARAFSAELA